MNLISTFHQGRLERAFTAGLSIRGAATYANVHKSTATRYFHVRPPVICPCGKQLPHREWCAWRVALSPARQKFIRSFANVSDSTLADWAAMRTQILSALSGTRALVQLDESGMNDLRRFYSETTFAFENDGDRSRIIAVAAPQQENTSYALYTALEKLHPTVKKFVLNIVDGASIREAADDLNISDEALGKILPPLRVFLKPYVTT